MMQRKISAALLATAFISGYLTPKSPTTLGIPPDKSHSLSLQRDSVSLAKKLSHHNHQARRQAQLELATTTDVTLLRSLLIEELENLRNSMSSEHTSEVIRRWAEVDPNGLLDFFFEELGGFSIRATPNHTQGFSIFETWATHDPDGALAALSRLPERERENAI